MSAGPTMPREYPRHPLPGVLALVKAPDGRILLVQRANEPDRGKWGLPGGLIELGETIADAALRELTEETGITASADKVMDIFEIITRDEAGRVRFHYVLSVVLCHWVEGEPVAGDDAAACGWVTAEDMEQLPTSRHLARLVALARHDKAEI